MPPPDPPLKPAPTPIPPAPGKQLPPGNKVQSLAAPPRELNVVAKFEWNPSMTDDQLIAKVAPGLTNQWAPNTADFSAVPGGAVSVASTFGEMLGAIWQQPVGSISRLNLFTHANPDMIALGGDLTEQSDGTVQVMLNTNGANDNLTAMDPTGMNNLNQPGVFFQVGPAAHPQNVSVADIRARFASGSVIVLYACHAGLMQSFVKSIATFFNVKVVGFGPAIVYHPPAQNTPHKFQRTGMQIALGASGAPVADWRGLINDPSARTATP